MTLSRRPAVLGVLLASLLATAILAFHALLPASAQAGEATKTPAAPTELTPKQILDQAKGLEAAGFDEASRELVKSLVSKEPKQSIPAELRAVNQRVGWWRKDLGKLGPVLRLALELAAVAIGLLVVPLLLWAGGRGLLLRGKPAAKLAGFTGSSENTLGDVLTAALGDALGRMNDENARAPVSWQSGTESKFEVPTAVTEALPQAGILAGLVQMLDSLLPRRLVTVSGTVHPVHEHRGAGLTLVVASRSGRTLDQVTIWEREFMLKKAGQEAKEAVRYERLILPGAIWLGYRQELGFKEKNAPLQTHQWRSYALFALGELVPNAKDQRKLYERALDVDSRNLGARLNLAALLLRRPAADVASLSGSSKGVDDGAQTRWRKRLDEAAVHLGYVALRAYPATDPVWYRARYLQAWCHIYLSDLSAAEAKHHGEEARRNLAQLQHEASFHGGEQGLRGLVRGLSKSAVVVDLIAELVQTKSVARIPDFDEHWLTATSEYNVACFWARYSALATASEKTERVAKSIAALRRTIERTNRAVREARIDPDFDAIRTEPDFVQLVPAKQPSTAPTPVAPTQYVITLDAGPDLTRLIAGYRAPA
jgi:hypothetical protein